MYDIPLLQKLFKFKTKARLIDTFLMSQLLNFNRTLGRYKGRHGLEMWGEHFGVLKGLEYQKDLERLAFTAGGRSQSAPAQRLTDVVEGRLSAEVKPTY